MAAMGLRIYAGRTFLLPLPSSEQPHLWIALTHPYECNENKIVIVNLTTLRDWSDTTLVLQRGEHRFIKHDTVVNYKDARVARTDAILATIQNGEASFDEDCTDELLELIQRKALVCTKTPKNVKTRVRNHLEGG